MKSNTTRLRIEPKADTFIFVQIKLRLTINKSLDANAVKRGKERGWREPQIMPPLSSLETQTYLTSLSDVFAERLLTSFGIIIHNVCSGYCKWAKAVSPSAARRVNCEYCTVYPGNEVMLFNYVMNLDVIISFV